MGTEAGAGAKPLTADRVTDEVEVMKAKPRAKPKAGAEVKAARVKAESPRVESDGSTESTTTASSTGSTYSATCAWRVLSQGKVN